VDKLKEASIAISIELVPGARSGTYRFAVAREDGDLDVAYFLKFLEVLSKGKRANQVFISELGASAHHNLSRFLQYVGGVASGTVVLRGDVQGNDSLASKCREYFSYLEMKCIEQGIGPVAEWKDGIRIASPDEAARKVLLDVVQETIDHLFDFHVDSRVNPRRAGPVQFIVSADDSRKQRGYFYVGDETAIIETHYECHLFVSLRNFALVPTILKTGWWEPWKDVLLRSLLRPGMSFANAGAHVGYHTMLGAKLVEHGGRVFGFEPNPHTYSLLKKTTFFNGFSERVCLYNAAVLDTAGDQNLVFMPGEGGGGRLGDALSEQPEEQFILKETYRNLSGTRAAIEVASVTLDGTVGSEVDKLNVLMMDIEGSEGAAVLGGGELIARSTDLKIIMEWSGERAQSELRSKFEQAVAFLGAQEFSFYRIVPPSGNVYTQPPDLQFVDPQDLFHLPHCDLFLTRS
jgi:FkbM family methyltransferase